MNTQAAHPEANTLTAFARGTLAPAEIEQVRRHLADCESCCRQLDEVPDDSLLGLVRQSGVDQTQLVGDDQTADDSDLAANEGADQALVTPSELLPHLPVELHDHPRYVVLAQIGTGGMGNVYRAQHRLMHRRVALKLINRDLVRHKHAAERFRREVRAAAALDHPNVVSALDAEQEGGLHLLVMEYVDGTTLHEVVRARGPLPIADACNYIRQAAEGLAHAHTRGMVHRDIKPHNLMLTNDGTVKILDFGLASLSEAILFEDEAPPQRADLTVAGAVMGTPDYISPEQATDARQADIRSDLYSLGATFYFLLTGQPPFTEGDIMDKLRAHAEEAPPPVESIRDDIPPELSAIVRRMMSKHPADRFQSPEELAGALAPFVDRHRHDKPPVRHIEAKPALVPPRAKSTLPIAIIVVVVMLVVAAAVGCLLFGLFFVGMKRVESAESLRRDMIAHEMASLAAAQQRATASASSARVTISSPVSGVGVEFHQGGEKSEYVVGAGSGESASVDDGGARMHVKQVLIPAGRCRVRLTGNCQGLVVYCHDFNLVRGEPYELKIRRLVPITHTRLTQGKFRLSEARILINHQTYLTSLAATSAGQRIYSGANSGILNTWNMQSAEIVSQVGAAVNRVPVAIREDGRQGISGGSDGKIYVWNLDAGERVKVLSAGNVNIRRIAYGPDEQTIVAVADDGSVSILHVQEDAAIRIAQARDAAIDAQFTASSDHVIAICEQSVKIWSVQFQDETSIRKTMEFPLKTTPAALAVSPDGQHFAVGASDGTVEVFTLDRTEAKAVFRAHAAEVTDMAYSADGKLLVTGGFDGKLAVWDAKQAKELASVTSVSPIFNRIALTRDGRLFTAGGITQGKPDGRPKVVGDFLIHEWHLQPE